MPTLQPSQSYAEAQERARAYIHEHGVESWSQLMIDLGRPLGSYDAYVFWEAVSSTWPMTVAMATKLYEGAGYLPFDGWPLTLANGRRRHV